MLLKSFDALTRNSGHCHVVLVPIVVVGATSLSHNERLVFPRNMPDDGYSSTWDSSDHSDFQSSAATPYSRPPLRSFDMHDAASTSQAHAISPPSFFGSESGDIVSTSPTWRDTSTISESLDGPSESVNLVEQGFDENILRQLCDMDVRPTPTLYPPFLTSARSVACHCSWTG